MTQAPNAREAARYAPVTKDMVFTAAGELAAQGRPVNTNALREHLGGGSFTTLTKHFKEWRSAQVEREAPAPVEIPEAVTRVLHSAISEIWRSVSADAQRKIVEVREASDRRVQEIEADQGLALDEVARLEKETADLKTDVTRHLARLTEQDQALAAARAVEDELRTRLTHEEKRARDLEVRGGELAAASAKMEKALAAAEAARAEHAARIRERDEALAAARAVEEELRQRLAAAEASGNVLKRERETAEREAEAGRRRAKDAEDEAQASKKSAEEAHRESAAMKAKLADCEKDTRAFKAVEAELRKNLDVERQARAEATTSHSELAKRFASLATELAGDRKPSEKKGGG